MKSILEYLKEQEDMANHNLFCYSATYGMDTPKEGCEKEFAEAVRDCEIVKELIELIKKINERVESLQTENKSKPIPHPYTIDADPTIPTLIINHSKEDFSLKLDDYEIGSVISYELTGDPLKELSVLALKLYVKNLKL